jgi:hypothetical protein
MYEIVYVLQSASTKTTCTSGRSHTSLSSWHDSCFQDPTLKSRPKDRQFWLLSRRSSVPPSTRMDVERTNASVHIFSSFISTNVSITLQYRPLIWEIEGAVKQTINTLLTLREGNAYRNLYAFILQHVDPLLSNDSITMAAVTQEITKKQQLNSNRGTVFSGSPWVWVINGTSLEFSQLRDIHQPVKT